MEIIVKNIIVTDKEAIEKEQFINLFNKYEYSFYSKYTTSYKFFKIYTITKTIEGMGMIKERENLILDISKLEETLKKCNLLGV